LKLAKGYYWVKLKGTESEPFVAKWNGTTFAHYWPSATITLAEVTVLSERLRPPMERG
jgi:hypothetical protein